jgi:hypothetical protein
MGPGLAFALAAAVCGQAAWGDSPAAASTPVPTVRAPLATALTSPTGSWTAVAMGEKGHPLNTFWQLFYRAPTAATWKLVTPPGVADNGGLTVSVTATGSAIVGFEPSQLLRYSPAAVSGDDGATWNPALVPVSLVAAPDALTVGPGGTAVALVRRGGGEVLTSSGPLLNWHPLAGRGVPGHAAAARCDISELDAVAFDPSDDALVGTGCRRPGQVGIFASVSGHWQLVGPSLPGSLAQATTRVLRLDTSGTTTTALVAEVGHHRTGLLGLWRSAAGTWTRTLPLVLGRATTVLASAIGPSGQQLVLLQNGDSTTLDETAGPDDAWVALPGPPAGTAAVAPLADGIDAFSVDGERLRVYTLAPSGSTWTLSQQMQVPIAYGTSS